MIQLINIYEKVAYKNNGAFVYIKVLPLGPPRTHIPIFLLFLSAKDSSGRAISCLVVFYSTVFFASGKVAGSLDLDFRT